MSFMFDFVCVIIIFFPGLSILHPPLAVGLSLFIALLPFHSFLLCFVPRFFFSPLSNSFIRSSCSEPLVFCNSVYFAVLPFVFHLVCFSLVLCASSNSFFSSTCSPLLVLFFFFLIELLCIDIFLICFDLFFFFICHCFLSNSLVHQPSQLLVFCLD